MNKEFAPVKKPNFLIVGAQKSGSTTLYYLLKQHPEIFLPDFKEPLFFISDIIKNISDKDKGFKNEGLKDKLIYSKNKYYQLFESAKNEIAIGESSASYLYYYKHAIPLIKKELGDPKIVIILRDPVSKVFSQYKHLLREHAENRSFEEGLNLETKRINENYTAMYHYKAQGLYFNQVKAYMDCFSDVLVVLTADLKVHPQSLAKKCYSFLSVNQEYDPILNNYNVSDKKINSRFVHKMLYNDRAHNIKMIFKSSFGSAFYEIFTQLYKKLNIGKINLEMREDTMLKLNSFFKKDIEQLEMLIDKDLSSWKKNKKL